MVIVDKASEALEDTLPIRDEDPPPSYNTPSSAGNTPNINPQLQTVMPMVTNYIKLIRKDRSIKGRYAIDPYLSVPSSFLPPLEEGETEADRKNLKLATKDGSIDVDVWVLGDGRSIKTEEGIVKEIRATLDLCSNDGSVTARIHTVSEMPKRTPFYLNVHARDGHVQIHIPRSFRGPMTMTVKDGTVEFSQALSTLVTTSSEVKNVHKYFVGCVPKSEQPWAGDVVEIYAKDGHVNILYEDEVRPKGFFRCMLGF